MLDGQHVGRRQRTNVLGHVGSQEQGGATLDDACGQVLCQLDGARRRRSARPARSAARPRPGRRRRSTHERRAPSRTQRQLDQRVAIDRPGAQRDERRASACGRVAERVQLLDPPLPQFLSAVSAPPCRGGRRPTPGDPTPAAAPARAPRPDDRFATRPRRCRCWSRSASCAGAERSGVRRQLGHLAGLGVEREPVPGQRRPERRVGHDRRVPDAVDRLEAVADADGVQPAPRPFGEHPRVDLEMQVPMWVAGPRGEVAYDGCLDLLDRHLHLPIRAARRGWWRARRASR